MRRCDHGHCMVPSHSGDFMSDPQQGFATRAIHAGQEPDAMTGAVNVPIYLTSTYAQQEIGKNKGYEYSRVSNPTRTALEQNLAALEGGSSAHVFASGMAAISALVAMLKTGDHVICGSNVLRGTPPLCHRACSTRLWRSTASNSHTSIPAIPTMCGGHSLRARVWCTSRRRPTR